MSFPAEQKHFRAKIVCDEMPRHAAVVHILSPRHLFERNIQKSIRNTDSLIFWFIIADALTLVAREKCIFQDVKDFLPHTIIIFWFLKKFALVKTIISQADIENKVLKNLGEYSDSFY